MSDTTSLQEMSPTTRPTPAERDDTGSTTGRLTIDELAEMACEASQQHDDEQFGHGVKQHTGDDSASQKLLPQGLSWPATTVKFSPKVAANN